jgi:CspA family cold shock protein
MRGISIVLSMLLLMYLAVLVVLRESFGYDRKDIRGDEMKYPVPPTVRTDFVCRRPSDTVSLNMASPRRLADKPCSFFCKGVALMPQGTIKKVIADKGFGFIESDKGDLFFHHSDLEGATIEALEIGQQVIYEEGQSPKGPCAQQVRPA